ncbi:uncharacterized protein LOC133451037 [Cololabis saira]|uniref:uncharacterized protein LOC133451037 n=1 Tax=Cololabis saira TaxID=129043 RepID=UPI002AD4B9B2|nr:uncharacterized protein LOC133451037 [Cololabis saira]
MSVQLCLVLLALSALTAESHHDCSDIIKPVEDRSKVYGKWIYHVGATDSEYKLKELTKVNSSCIEISPLPGGEEFSLHYGDKMDGKCVYGTVNSTTTGNSTKLTFSSNSSTHEVTGSALVTCPDCLLWSDDAVTEVNGESKRSKSLLLFTKTGKLDASHLDVFKKQAECLHLLSDFHFPETTNLCPEEKEAAGDAKTEEQ